MKIHDICRTCMEIQCIRIEVSGNIGNMYGNIQKYNAYVWNCMEISRICSTIYGNIWNMYGNIWKDYEYVRTNKKI